MQFSEIIKLQFGKKAPYIALYFTGLEVSIHLSV